VEGVLVIIALGFVLLIAGTIFIRMRANAAWNGVTISVAKPSDEVWSIIKKQFLPVLWVDQGTSFRRRAAKDYGYTLSVDVRYDNGRTVVRMCVSEGNATGAANGYSKIKSICRKLRK